uniref:R3H domain-containing protein n=1 Tax=Peronospora matthiolae TaxID=2874970 RepID=A0AAV1V8G7_9STRA
MKIAFKRDPAPDDEKHRVFGELLTEPDQNCSGVWDDSFSPILHGEEKVKGVTIGLPVQLNVIRLRENIEIKDGPPKMHKEHVEHYIETLGDPEMADQLTILHLADANVLEDVLRAKKRTKARRFKILFESSKFLQKALVPRTDQEGVTRRLIHEVRATLKKSSSKDLSLDNSGDLRRIHLMARGGH